MAEAITKAKYGDRIRAFSAGVSPKTKINAQSAASVAEIGASMEGATPKGLDDELLRSADRVVIIGAAAQLDFPDDARGSLERWITDEPSERGIEGAERMRLIRDDIARRVDKLAAQLLD
nr:low molecular weight phosphatase family protein [Corynebacterium lactis]